MTVARGAVLAGENIVTLAARLTGDARRWQELVTLNGLTPPYVSDAGGPGVLAPGDAVLYPTSSEPAPTVDAALLEVRTYFRDLAVEGGDLQFNAAGGLVTVSGLENLQAALGRRLRTLIGRHPFHPGFGNRAVLALGEVADEGALALLASDTRAAITRDPRVQDCAVALEWASTHVLRAHLTVTPVPPGTVFTLSELLDVR